MHLQRGDQHRTRAVLRIACLLGVMALFASASMAPARERVLRRLPQAAAANQVMGASDEYNPSRVFHQTWNQPGVAYYPHLLP